MFSYIIYHPQKSDKSLSSTFQHKFNESEKVEDKDLAHLLKDGTKVKLFLEIKPHLRTGVARSGLSRHQISRKRPKRP